MLGGKNKTQVEISLADGFTWYCSSGKDSDVTGPGLNSRAKGRIGNSGRLIAAARHIHINPDDAETLRGRWAR